MPTHYDRIKAMSIEELAAKIENVDYDLMDRICLEINPQQNCDGNKDCKDCIKRWLESEVDNANNIWT